ncbi:protein singles bar-like [Portunus trituberculatus]|uniref:protein singles bar-like n=1 Tax=Portunus trituberculatus TaxID=210409 RepID=UPI001E1CF27F|nr:protein singles bar-like [Portunus trituberculatus]XP_045126954.1 protein singles bar-like [Portunus trituberculatus]
MRQEPTVGWSAGAGRPTVIQPSVYRSTTTSEGIKCCCCNCCTCVNLNFLRTKPGLLKAGEMILSAICLTLVLDYGLPYSSTMGESFTVFLLTTCACLLVVSLLLFCYIISANSFNLIRSSVLETVFNTLACVLYLTSSSYLSWSVYIWLLPGYRITPHYTVYPAMSAAYILGFVLGVVHGLDAWTSYRHLK